MTRKGVAVASRLFGSSRLRGTPVESTQERVEGPDPHHTETTQKPAREGLEEEIVAP